MPQRPAVPVLLAALTALTLGSAAPTAVAAGSAAPAAAVKAAVVKVGTTKQLQSALAAAAPGQTIQLCGTVFRGNRSDLTGATGPDRYAIHVTAYDAAKCKVTIGAGNTVTGGRGLVNPGIPVG